jgi:hypothetical protein
MMPSSSGRRNQSFSLGAMLVHNLIRAIFSHSPLAIRANAGKRGYRKISMIVATALVVVAVSSSGSLAQRMPPTTGNSVNDACNAAQTVADFGAIIKSCSEAIKGWNITAQLFEKMGKRSEAEIARFRELQLVMPLLNAYAQTDNRGAALQLDASGLAIAKNLRNALSPVMRADVAHYKLLLEQANKILQGS